MEGATCISLLICDQVIDDRRSGNKSFIGSFNAIYAQSLPCTHPRMCIVVSVTNMIGPHTIGLSIRTPSDIKLFEAKGPAESPDPLQVVDLLFEILGLPLSETGTFFVDAFCDEHHLATRRFQVLITPSV